MERERGNPLRPVCDGCRRRWYGHGLLTWGDGRKLCVDRVSIEDAAERFAALAPEERRAVCPKVHSIEEAIR